MKLILKLTVLLLFIQWIPASARQQKGKSRIAGQVVTYVSNGITMKGYVAYDASLTSKRPGIVVVHEWWGCNEYARKRARMLAELGYIAFAADMYGDGQIAKDPKMAKELATPFYQHPEMAKERIEAAFDKLKEYTQTDQNKVGGIGYCFGGSMLLNAAKSGLDCKGVVSFHGGLAGVPASKGSTKANLLICHGGADQFVSKEDMNQFRQNLDSMNVSYQFIIYPGATHAFTNPEATATGKKFDMPIEYNEEGDMKSWKDMSVFLEGIFR